MVDGSVVVVENVFSRLSHGSNETRLHLDVMPCAEVATPVIFGVLIIVLVFLPLMTLEGTEGKMFAPLAYTIAIALLLSLGLSLSLSPALSMFWLKGGSEKDTKSSIGCALPTTRHSHGPCKISESVWRQWSSCLWFLSACSRSWHRLHSGDAGIDTKPKCGSSSQHLA